MSESKFKAFTQNIDKILRSFDNSNEWADLISNLARIKKLIEYQTPKFGGTIPRLVQISKRLCQCLHPNLPSGVHLKAIDVYFALLNAEQNLGGDSKCKDSGGSSRLLVYTPAICQLYPHSSYTVRPQMLRLIEVLYLPAAVHQGSRTILPCLLASLFAAVDEPASSEHADGTPQFLDKLMNASALDSLGCPKTDPPEFDVFFDALWSAVAIDKLCRLPALEFVLTKLERREASAKDVLGIGTERLQQNAPSICACLTDDSNLVRRSSLDIIVRFVPTSISVGNTLEKLMSNVLPIVLLHDASLNRRILTWILGPSNTDNHLLNHSRPLLIRTILRKLNTDGPLDPHIVLIFNYLLEQPQLTPILLDSPILIKIMLLCTANSACSEVRKCFQSLIFSLRPNYLWSVVTDNFVSLTQNQCPLPATDISFEKLASLSANLLDSIGDQCYCGLHRLQDRLLTSLVKRFDKTSSKNCAICIRIAMDVQNQMKINKLNSGDPEVITEFVLFEILDRIDDQQRPTDELSIEHRLMSAFAKHKVFLKSEDSAAAEELFEVICDILLKKSKGNSVPEQICMTLMGICGGASVDFAIRCRALEMIAEICSEKQYEMMFRTGFVTMTCRWLYSLLDEHFPAKVVAKSCELLMKCERIWSSRKPVEKMLINALCIDLDGFYTDQVGIRRQEQMLERLCALWNYSSRQMDDSLSLLKNVFILLFEQLPRLSDNLSRNDYLIESTVIRLMLDPHFERLILVLVDFIQDDDRRLPRKLQQGYHFLVSLINLCPEVFIRRLLESEDVLIDILFRTLNSTLRNPSTSVGLRNECLVFLRVFFLNLSHQQWHLHRETLGDCVTNLNELWAEDPLDITRCRASLAALPFTQTLESSILSSFRAQVVSSIVCRLTNAKHQRSLGLIVCSLRRLIDDDQHQQRLNTIYPLVVQQICECLLDISTNNPSPQTVLNSLRYLWTLAYLNSSLKSEDNLYFGQSTKVCVAYNFALTTANSTTPNESIKQLVRPLLTTLLAALISVTSIEDDESGQTNSKSDEIREVVRRFIDNLIRDYETSAMAALIMLWGERRHRFKLINATNCLVRFLEHYLPPEFLFSACTEVLLNPEPYAGDRKIEDFRIWITQVVLSFFEKLDYGIQANARDPANLDSSSSTSASVSDQICGFAQKAADSYHSAPEIFLLLRLIAGLVSRTRFASSSDSDVDVLLPRGMKNVQLVIVELVSACNLIISSSLQHSSWFKRGSGYVMKSAIVQTQSPVMDLSRTLSNCGGTLIAENNCEAARQDLSQNDGSAAESDDTNSLAKSSAIDGGGAAFRESQKKRPNTEIRLFSLQAIVVLADHLPNLLEGAFRSDEKERTIVPLLTTLLTNLLPFLKMRRQSNSPSVRAASRLLQRMSQYAYARRVLKKDVIDHFFDPMFFYFDRDALQNWMTMIHNFLSNDRTLFKEILGRVNTVQTGLFITSEQESEQKAKLMRRLSLVVLSAPFDYYQRSIPELHDYISEILKATPTCSLHAQIFTLIRALTLRFSSRYLVSLFPIIHSELLQLLINLEEALKPSTTSPLHYNHHHNASSSTPNHRRIDLMPSSPQPSSARSVATSSPSSLLNLIHFDSPTDLNQSSLDMLCAAFKLIEMLLSLPVDDLPQFQSYRCTFSTMTTTTNYRKIDEDDLQNEPHLCQLNHLIENIFDLSNNNHQQPLQHPILTVRQISSLKDLHAVVSALCHYSPDKACADSLGTKNTVDESARRLSGIWKKFEFVLLDEFSDDWIKKH